MKEVISVQKTVAANGCETEAFSDVAVTEATDGGVRGDKGARGEVEGGVARWGSAKTAGGTVGVVVGEDSRGRAGSMPGQINATRGRRRRSFLEVRKA